MRAGDWTALLEDSGIVQLFDGENLLETKIAALAVSAAQISIETRLPLTDSIIMAVARQYQAILWTQDDHFNGLDGVQFFEKK